MKPIRFLLLVTVCLIGWANSSYAYEGGFTPISFESPTASIKLTVLGTYRGGMFSRVTPGGPPQYHPRTKRLFIGSGHRSNIEVLDISDPTVPTKVFEIDLTSYGGEANAIDLHGDLLAATVKNAVDPTRPSQLVFFNVDGEPVSFGNPIVIDGLSRVLFTPSGFRVIATISASPNDDYTVDGESGIAIVDLRPVIPAVCSFAQLLCQTTHGKLGTCEAVARACTPSNEVSVVGFHAFNDRKDELVAAGVRIVGPNATVAQDLEPSGMSLSRNGRFAYVNLATNNAWAEVDLWAKTVTRILPYGYKDNSLLHNGIDASDRDNKINIQPWPIRSWYMPKDIQTFDHNGQRFIITANEGNLIDLSGWTEVTQVKNVVLDPLVFPNAADLKADAALGRLDISRLYGDKDGDGDYDAIYTGGGRSFSIFTVDGKLVFDSGADFEQITAQAVPANFNCADDENKFDVRSRKKGPEAEHVVLGWVGDKRYAFISFERIGGVIVYDVTDPYAPIFQQYMNNRNFGVEPKVVCGTRGMPELPGCSAVGDLEPEALSFIPASKSPTGMPLFVIMHEASDSITVYSVDSVAR